MEVFKLLGDLGSELTEDSAIAIADAERVFRRKLSTDPPDCTSTTRGSEVVVRVKDAFLNWGDRVAENQHAYYYDSKEPLYVKKTKDRSSDQDTEPGAALQVHQESSYEKGNLNCNEACQLSGV